MTSANAHPDANANPREGSTLYYSLLFNHPEARLRVCQTLNLIKVISTTLYDVSEPTVAEKKIHWWHEELARLAQGSARHPAAVLVQTYLHSKDAANACLSILSAAANERYTPLATDTDLHDMLAADYSARIKLVELALVGNEPTITPTSARLPFANEKNTPASPVLPGQNAMALGLGQVHRLSTLAPRLQHGYSVFSDELFTQHELTPERLHNDPATGSAFIHYAIEQAHNTLTQALDEQNNGASQHVLPVYLMARLRFSQVQLWKTNRADLVREYTTVTPLRKFFIAYRSKRLFAKVQNTAS